MLHNMTDLAIKWHVVTRHKICLRRCDWGLPTRTWICIPTPCYRCGRIGFDLPIWLEFLTRTTALSTSFVLCRIPEGVSDHFSGLCWDGGGRTSLGPGSYEESWILVHRHMREERFWERGMGPWDNVPFALKTSLELWLTKKQVYSDTHRDSRLS
jgi:hypothetical protein